MRCPAAASRINLGIRLSGGADRPRAKSQGDRNCARKARSCFRAYSRAMAARLLRCLFGIEQHPDPAAGGFGAAAAHAIMLGQPPLQVQRPAHIGDACGRLCFAPPGHRHNDGHGVDVPRSVHGWQGAKAGLRARSDRCLYACRSNDCLGNALSLTGDGDIDAAFLSRQPLQHEEFGGLSGPAQLQPDAAPDGGAVRRRSS